MAADLKESQRESQCWEIRYQCCPAGMLAESKATRSSASFLRLASNSFRSSRHCAHGAGDSRHANLDCSCAIVNGSRCKCSSDISGFNSTHKYKLFVYVHAGR